MRRRALAAHNRLLKQPAQVADRDGAGMGERHGRDWARAVRPGSGTRMRPARRLQPFVSGYVDFDMAGWPPGRHRGLPGGTLAVVVSAGDAADRAPCWSRGCCCCGHGGRVAVQSGRRRPRRHSARGPARADPARLTGLAGAACGRARPGGVAFGGGRRAPGAGADRSAGRRIGPGGASAGPGYRAGGMGGRRGLPGRGRRRSGAGSPARPAACRSPGSPTRSGWAAAILASWSAPSSA